MVIDSRVLIITGGIVSPRDTSVSKLLRKQFSQLKVSQHHWLEVKIKTVIAETVLVGELEKRRTIKATSNPKLKTFLQSQVNFDTPDLTEVSLASLLKKEGIPYELATYDDLFANNEDFQRKWKACDVVFASCTFLRDLSELIPIVEKLKGSHNRLVVGGALTGTLSKAWQGHDKVDIVAMGYGEFLIPVLARWIKSKFNLLQAPENGRIEHRHQSIFLYSGVPSGLSLDFIERPDWGQSEIDRKTRYSMINYESVRGCPYRCAFCNYPYLFDDSTFRMKSAIKMADDWETYARELQIEYITCLDSLFTMPKQRLVEFCEQLIARHVKVKWICYARADDLCDEYVVDLLVRSGCIQVQIGIESGDEQILKNMNKRTSIEINKKAIENCRKYKLTSVATLIVGFPGETKATLENTLQFLKSAPPDFFFIATFSTRVPGVPILSAKSRAQFGLVTMDNLYSVSPYWAHSSMKCNEASNWSRWLTAKIIENKISLDAALLYKSILFFDPDLREELLEMQARGWRRGLWLRKIFDGINKMVDFFFRKDLNKFLADSSKVDEVAGINPIANERERIKSLEA